MAKKKKAQEEDYIQPEHPEAALVKKLYTRFQNAEVAVTPKHEIWNVLDMFDRGEQWKNASLPPWVPKPVTNFIRYIRTLKRANLASMIPMAHYTPEYEEDAPIIAKLDKGYRHVWEKERVPRTIRRNIDRVILQGTTIAYVYDDESYVGGKYIEGNKQGNQLFMGNICVKRIPNSRFFPDPDAYCIDECKYVEFTEDIPLSQVKNTKRYIDHAGKEAMSTLSGESAYDEAESGEIYNRDTKRSDNNNRQKGDEMLTIHHHFERYFGEDHKWHMNIYSYTRHADFLLCEQKDVPISKFYPFAVLYDEEEENSFWGSSTVMDFLENQKIINKTAQTASMLGSLHQNPQKVVSRESGVNAQELARSGTLAGKVWTANGDPSKAIHINEPAKIPKELFDIEDRMKQDIREMAGVNEAYTGQSVGSLTTSSGVNSLIERSTIRDKDKMIQIDEFVERISDLIILNIGHKWQDERPTVHTGPDGKPVYGQYEPIDKDIMDNLDWRCRSDIYAKAPTTQASRRQQAEQMMNMQGQYNFQPAIITPEELMRFQEFDFREEVMQRMEKDRKRMEQEKPQVLAQQIMQAVGMFHQATSQGAPFPDAMNQAMQMVTQILQQQQQAEMNGKAPSAQQAQGPQGTTGALAMQAMTKGRM